ncbi:transcription antitermination factor NusB [Psittacicella hinzii]|uniref:Transcription antitermination factor NusB n=1 Tax=Psittacicella hinzii TaxID=2028575 RepID=A0A3A1YG03_9GAMM|nr:transcription antitermination factor NusB [Psittacicella hinzii]RIY36481.1 transcription antitermination factor NusB [Psittacicella hinzii]
MINNTPNLRRRVSRLAACQCLYSYDLTKNSATNIFTQFLEFHAAEQATFIFDEDYFRHLFFGTVQQINYLDEIIAQQSSRNIKLIDPIVRAILRYSIFELLDKTTPAPVVIDEALEVTKAMVGKGIHTFVHSILDSTNKKYNSNENNSLATNNKNVDEDNQVNDISF